MARTNRTAKIRLGELLVAAGLVTDDKVRMGLEEQRRNNLFLGEALVQLGFVTEEAIAQAIIQHFNLPFLSASQFTILPEVFNLFPERMYNEYQFIAVDKIERVIIIIAAGPINQDMMEELERVSECKICHYVSTWRDIFAAIQRNSKELGGEAQAELTGLGSLLLDAPTTGKSTATITQKMKKLESPSMSVKFGNPNLSRTMHAPAKTVNAANLSALLSPLGVSSKSAAVSQIVSTTPPSPRLTAFLKVTPPGNPSNSAPVIHRGASLAGIPPMRALSSENIPAIRMGGASSPNLSAVTGVPAGPASTGMINAVNASSGVFQVHPSSPESGGNDKNPEKPLGKDAPVPPKRMSSFLSIRRN